MRNCRLAIDVCSGSGVGAIHIAKCYPSSRVYALDINPKAVQFGTINALHLLPNRPSSSAVEFLVSDGFSAVNRNTKIQGKVDLVTINPPFIAGERRTYAAGGKTGKDLVLRLIGEAREVLRMGGELWSHMAAPVRFDGTDTFKEAWMGWMGGKLLRVM